jgi:hypothetical protein
MRWEGGEEVRGRLRPLAGITGDDVVGELGDCGGSGCFEALREAAGAGGFGVRGGESFDLGEGKVLMAAGDAQEGGCWCCCAEQTCSASFRSRYELSTA